jgi:acyl carrier protein
VSFGYDPLAERVLAFTAQQRGVAVEKIDLLSRLVEDLGLHGDDAIEFFDAFSREFDVNLDALHGKRWKHHFGPEAQPAGPPLVAIFVLLTLFVTASIIGGYLGWTWLWFLAFVATWLFGSKAWPLRLLVPDTVPITVQDLVDAAAAGRWVKPVHSRGS